MMNQNMAIRREITTKEQAIRVIMMIAGIAAFAFNSYHLLAGSWQNYLAGRDSLSYENVKGLIGIFTCLNVLLLVGMLITFPQRGYLRGKHESSWWWFRVVITLLVLASAYNYFVVPYWPPAN